MLRHLRKQYSAGKLAVRDLCLCLPVLIRAGRVEVELVTHGLRRPPAGAAALWGIGAPSVVVQGLGPTMPLPPP